MRKQIDDLKQSFTDLQFGLSLMSDKIDRSLQETRETIFFCRACSAAWELGDLVAMEQERDRLAASLMDRARTRQLMDPQAAAAEGAGSLVDGNIHYCD